MHHFVIAFRSEQAQPLSCSYPLPFIERVFAMIAASTFGYPFKLLTKNTFLEFDFAFRPRRRNASAPPSYGDAGKENDGATKLLFAKTRKRHTSNQHRNKSKPNSFKVMKKQIEETDNAAFLEFNSKAHQERWSFWAASLLSKHRRICSQWRKFLRKIARERSRWVHCSTIAFRSFAHLIHFSTSPVLTSRCLRGAFQTNGSWVQISVPTAFQRAAQVQKMIRAAEYLRALAESFRIAFYIPNRMLREAIWEPTALMKSVSAALHQECCAPVQLYCMGRQLHGVSLGLAGVRPGDIIEVRIVK